VKVAYFSPLPPERSGIADYAALLLPALRERVDVVLARRGRRAPAADLRLYHVGNDPESHGWIVEELRRRPGVVVLHDFVLHHLVAGMTIGRGNGRAYLAAVEREGGIAGRLLAHGVLDRVIPPLWETRPEEFPLVSEVLDAATGLVVHSRFVARHARARGYEGPIWRVPHPAWPRPAELPDPGLPAGRSPVVGCLGNLNATKRVPQLLAAFARLRERYPGALLVLAGTAAARFGLDARLDRLGLLGTDAVLRLDYVDEPRLWSLLDACDVSVSLRSPTMGETSGIAIRTLSLGRPLVVSDVGWFSELPDSVVAKVPVDEWEVDTLAATLELLADDPGLRAAMGTAARSYAEREHSLERAAEGYAAALEEAAGGEAVSERLLAAVARAAGEVGIAPESPELARVAERLGELYTTLTPDLRSAHPLRGHSHRAPDAPTI
jgi:glycosyltransferase involved in cell wall biosynthesis